MPMVEKGQWRCVSVKCSDLPVLTPRASLISLLIDRKEIDIIEREGQRKRENVLITFDFHLRWNIWRPLRAWCSFNALNLV